MNAPNQKQCNSCGRLISSKAKFCPICGAVVAIPEPQTPERRTSPAPSVQNEFVPQEPKKKDPISMILIIAGAVLLTGCIILGVLLFNKYKAPSAPEDTTVSQFVTASATETEPTASTINESTDATNPTAPTTQNVTEATTEHTENPGQLSSGETVYKNMKFSFTQTADNEVELLFDNTSPDSKYKIVLWFQSTTDRGFTVIVTDENGLRESVVVKDWGSVATFLPYTASEKTTLHLNNISGRITSVMIMGAAYHNSEDWRDSGGSETITIYAQ